MCGYWGVHFKATHIDDDVIASVDEEAQLFEDVEEESVDPTERQS